MGGEASRTERGRVFPAREVILQVLARAADDHKFLARLAENPHRVLQEYDLGEDERLVLAQADAEILESWVGPLDERLRTWPKVRRNQNTW